MRPSVPPPPPLNHGDLRCRTGTGLSPNFGDPRRYFLAQTFCRAIGFFLPLNASFVLRLVSANSARVLFGNFCTCSFGKKKNVSWVCSPSKKNHRVIFSTNLCALAFCSFFHVVFGQFSRLVLTISALRNFVVVNTSAVRSDHFSALFRPFRTRSCPILPLVFGISRAVLHISALHTLALFSPCFAFRHFFLHALCAGVFLFCLVFYDTFDYYWFFCLFVLRQFGTVLQNVETRGAGTLRWTRRASGRASRGA